MVGRLDAETGVWAQKEADWGAAQVVGATGGLGDGAGLLVGALVEVLGELHTLRFYPDVRTMLGGRLGFFAKWKNRVERDRKAG